LVTGEVPGPEVLPEGDTNVTAGEMAIGDPAASIDPAGGASVEESRVILGHPMLRAPGDVSLDEAMGTARWALTQAQDVLHWKSGGINDERQHLMLWASMLKERTTTERARAEAR
jgi:hypothetical protein